MHCNLYASETRTTQLKMHSKFSPTTILFASFSNLIISMVVHGVFYRILQSSHTSNSKSKNSWYVTLIAYLDDIYQKFNSQILHIWFLIYSK